MMKCSTKYRISSLIGMAMALGAVNAHAGFSWTLDSSPSGGSCQSAFVGNACYSSDTDGGNLVTMTATGWASSRSGNTASTLEQATLRRYDGIGVSAQGEGHSSPRHAADNSGKLESIVYSFSSGGSAVDVILDSVIQGWHRDADFSLLAYTGHGGAAATPGDLTNRSYNDLTSNGWELVSNNTYHEYNSRRGTDIVASDDASNDYQTSDLNSGRVAASHWMIAVLNGAFWNHSNYIGNDYIKVKTLTGSLAPKPPTSVSAPSTIALFGLALAALICFQPRQRASRFEWRA